MEVACNDSKGAARTSEFNWSSMANVSTEIIAINPIQPSISNAMGPAYPLTSSRLSFRVARMLFPSNRQRGTAGVQRTRSTAIMSSSTSNKIAATAIKAMNSGGLSAR